MRRLRSQLLRVTGAVLGAIGAVILMEVIVSALSSGSNPIANWAIANLGKVFRPISGWFVDAPDWAWISIIMVLGVPASLVLTWAVDEAGLGIRRQHKPRWTAGIWIFVVFFTCACIRWARTAHGF